MKKSEKKYTRKLSSSERLYVAADQIDAPFSVQFMVEGSGNIDMDKFNKAVEKASEANPGARVILKGHLHQSRWVDSGITPPVRELDNNGWDSMSQYNMPDIKRPLDPRNGPVSEIVILRDTDSIKIVFRALHSVMDGGGLIHWAKDIFRCLRDESLVGSNSTLADADFLKSFKRNEYRKNYPQDCTAPTGKKENSLRKYKWKRIRLDGQYPGFIAQIAVILAQEAYRVNKNTPVRFMIPTDLRLLKPSINSTGNLSNPLYIEVARDDSWKKVYNNILRQLAEKKQTVQGKYDNLLRYIPLSLIRNEIKRTISNQNKNQKFGLTGIISHVGRLNKKLYEGGGFIPESGFFIPSNLPVMPLFAGAMELDDGIELIFSVPQPLASDGRIEELIDTIRNRLEKKIFKKEL